MLEQVLLLLVIISWIYWIIAMWMVRAFFRSPPKAGNSYMPSVSILKPVRGLDYQAFENFASFCVQDYPDYELLFGVADADDPAVAIVEQLKNHFPQSRIQLVVGPLIGANRKVSLLDTLAAEAHNEILVISDSDMRVTPEYLGVVVEPLSDARVGLVTCPYRGVLPHSLSACLEAYYMNVTFLPSMIVARRFLDMRFAMGATNVLRKTDLNKLGGFRALADFLADDYQLGAQIANLGQRVVLSQYIVDTVLGKSTFHEQWQREVRWARCNRISRPREYPGLILSFSIPLAMAFLMFSVFSAQGWLVFLTSLFVRWLVAWLVMGFIGNEALRPALGWLPVRDVLTAWVWLAGGIGRRVYWRGEEFILQDDGRMQPISMPDEARQVSS